jgi:hypothetical protein
MTYKYFDIGLRFSRLKSEEQQWTVPYQLA